MPGLFQPDPNPSLNQADRRGIDRALELAALADYATSPNPMVGAVIVDSDGAVVGEGYHQRAGQAHAEQLALDAAGARARGGSLYVNLEPCAHHGRTPPCADAVVRAGIRRVVVSMRDPDPRTAGAGLERMRQAGVEVEVGAGEARARRLNEFYIKHRTTGLPFVSVRFAASLDGKIATRTGDSHWISGQEARRHSHQLRHQHDAILVGIGTVLKDDPLLTARFEGARQPLRVVADSKLRTPAGARLLPALVATVTGGTLPGAEVLHLGADARGRVDLRGLLAELGRRQLLSVVVEGGGELHGSLFDAGLVDKVYAYMAPLIIGGRSAPTAVGGEGPRQLAEGFRLQSCEIKSLGEEVLVSGYVHRDS